MPISHPRCFSCRGRGEPLSDAHPRHRGVGLCRRRARPAPAGRRPHGARVRPLTGAGRRRRCAARRRRDRRRRQRRRPRTGARRHRRRVLPDPLDGGSGQQRLPRARAPRRRAVRHRRARRPACAGSSTSAAWCRRGQPVAPSCLAPGGRAGPARGRRRGDRAARLDRDRRPLALVPLPRAPDRAPARARAPRLARPPHPADRRPRRARLPRPRGRRAGRARRSLVGHRRAGGDDLPAPDRADRRGDARAPPVAAPGVLADAGGFGRRRGGRHRGPRLHHAPDGVPRERPAPA